MSPSFLLKAAVMLLISLPLRVFATPFDPARVPAEADGVGHLDMDALRKTALHRLLRPKITQEKWEEIDPKLRAVLRALFDAAQGVSFWLTDPDTGAVLIQVPDPQKIKLLLDKLPHKGEIRVAGYVARKLVLSRHTSAAGNESSLAALVGNLLILADDQTSLGKAIGAAAGKTKSLSAAGRVPEGAAERGLFFFSTLNHKLLDQVKNAAQSQTLRINMSSLTVRVAEVSSALRVRVKLSLSTPEEAQKVRSMADGLIALVSMSDDAELGPLLQSVKVTANGKAVEVALSLPSADFIKMIDSND